MTKTGRSQEVRVTVIYLLSGGSKGRRGPFDFALMFDESQLFNGFESNHFLQDDNHCTIFGRLILQDGDHSACPALLLRRSVLCISSDWAARSSSPCLDAVPHVARCFRFGQRIL